MLYNTQNQVVHVDKKHNSRDNPSMFRDLQEKLEPKSHKEDKMFRLDQRAKLINCRSN